MSVIRLLTLGAVRQRGRTHGYQVRSDLESWGAHEWSTAKPGSIYHALKQLAAENLLVSHNTKPSKAGGPPRTEYEVTPEGDRVFLTLLRDALRGHDQKFDELTAAVGFIICLPRKEVIELLQERVAAYEQLQQQLAEYWTPDSPRSEWEHIEETMRLWIHNATSGAEWTRGLIKRLKDGAYVMAGEK